MIQDKMVSALNDQFALELYSSNLYLAMSAWCENKNLPGFARWLRIQAEEERSHAMKLFDYLVDQGAQVKVPAVQQPKGQYEGLVHLFKEVLGHERKVTEAIHRLQGLAAELNDYATRGLLDWFVKEQIEEEKNAGLLLAHLEMVDDRGGAILQLDHMAGKRGG